MTAATVDIGDNVFLNLSNFHIIPSNDSGGLPNLHHLDVGDPNRLRSVINSNMTYLRLTPMKLNSPTLGRLRHRVEVDKLESRLEADDAQRTLQDALVVAMQSVSGWGPGALARSTMTAIGSVLVSLLIGLVLWMGILQYIGIPRKNTRRNSFLEQHEMLNVIAEKVVRDLATFSRNADRAGGDDAQAIKSPSNIEHQFVPIHPKVKVIPFDDPGKVIRRDGNYYPHDEDVPLVHDTTQPKSRFRNFDSTRRTIGTERVYLKRFIPSPVDDVITTVTKVPSYKRKNLYVKRHPSQETVQLRHNYEENRPAKARRNHEETKSVLHYRFPADKPLLDRNAFHPRINFELQKKSKTNMNREYLQSRRKSKVENQFPSLQESNVDEHFERVKNSRLGEEYWKNLNLRNVGTGQLESLSDRSNQFSRIFDRSLHVPTEQPVAATTFRTNRKFNFMDILEVDPYEVDQYFPNHFQPVNSYSDGDYVNSHETIDAFHPHLQDEMLQRIRNLYDTFIQNDGSQTPISEYLDPTSHVANRHLFETRYLQRLSEYPHPNESFRNSLPSLNELHGDFEEERNSMEIHENFLNHQIENPFKAGNVSLNVAEQPSELFIAAPSNEISQQFSDNGPVTRTPVYNATGNEGAFDKVKGISDELLMALFPDYMKKHMTQSLLNHNHKD